MSKVICISNQKGGVGKTTTSTALAVCLKARGFSVLAIDLDSQGNLSFCLGADNENSATMYDVLKGNIKMQFAIQRTPIMDVIASNILISGIELEFTNTGREFLLREAMNGITGQYDYIIIDTPPALSVLTINAFTAADCIVVPMLSDIFSLQGITQLYESVERVKKYCNPKLSIAGILLTKFNPRALLSNEIRGTAELISKDLDIPIFNSYIRNSIGICEALSLQKNLLAYSPRSNTVWDYIAFTNELLERGI